MGQVNLQYMICHEDNDYMCLCVYGKIPHKQFNFFLAIIGGPKVDQTVIRI